MSLINKMLQDLDARGGAPHGAAGAESNVKPVLRDERRPPLLLAGGVLLLLLALAVAGYFGWRTWQRSRVVVAAAPSAPATVKKIILLTPAPQPTPVEAALEARPTPEVKPAPELKVPELKAPEVKLAHEVKPAHAVKPAPVAEPAPTRAKPHLAEAKTTGAGAPVNGAAPVAVSPHQSAQQRAETEYRRALASLQEGRTGDAIASLEQALLIEPRHEAARQTVVGLLIENKRPDDAMRHLQLALGAEPRQPALAMLLARLQIERGGSGVDTLLRSLPYVAGNADYHAFLAGALQRQQRHREAAEQYQAALRAQPQNGVWLMGLGISLQAEKRNADALAAFQKASSSASLSPELQAFVERKLQQLSH
jgi:MSHA biogenesis protein MshN